MAANFCSEVSGRGITLWILCLAAVFAVAVNVSAQQPFTSGSDGSDGAYDLIGTAPGTIVKFDPTQFHGSGVQNNVFNFTTITIPSGVTVELSGDRLTGPVYWLAQGNVDIEGTVDLNGQAGAPQVATLDVRTRAIPGAGGFAGGVGGKYDTFPIPAGEPGAQPGDGPLGGVVGPTTNCLSLSSGGNFSGNLFLVPLVGGSGGGGANIQGVLLSTPYGLGGGAGGGAILIASSSSIAVNGTISANGGHARGGASCIITGDGGTGTSAGGAGAGGGIRLTAPTINGSGTLTAVGGVNDSAGGVNTNGANGAIRLEAFADNFGGKFNGTPVSVGSPLSTSIPANGPASVKVLSVNGVSVTQPPTGTFATPDVTINSTSPVSVIVQATNIPPGTVLTLRVFSVNDMDQTVQTTPLFGTLQSSTATATVTFPTGFSSSYVKATWTP